MTPGGQLEDLRFLRPLVVSLRVSGHCAPWLAACCFVYEDVCRQVVVSMVVTEGGGNPSSIRLLLSTAPPGGPQGHYRVDCWSGCRWDSELQKSSGVDFLLSSFF